VGAKLLQFDSMVDYEEVAWSQIESDPASQRAAVAAAAAGLAHGVVPAQLVYVSATDTATAVRRRLSTRCTVTVEVTVPLQQLPGCANASQAYSDLTASLTMAVASGAYALALADAAAVYGATAVQNVSVTGVVSTAAKVFEVTGAPSVAPTAASSDIDGDSDSDWLSAVVSALPVIPGVEDAYLTLAIYAGMLLLGCAGVYKLAGLCRAHEVEAIYIPTLLAEESVLVSNVDDWVHHSKGFEFESGVAVENKLSVSI
jgi:hypothetical protein